MRHFLRFMVVSIAFGISSANSTVAQVYAQQGGEAAPEITITMTDSLVNLEEGRVATRDEEGALLLNPGDHIRFQIEAENIGTDAAYDVEVVYPIPEGTEYIMESAKGPAALITYSIDGGDTFVLPTVMYSERNADGVLEEKPAPASMFTHVKWRFSEPIQPLEKKIGQVVVKVSDQ